MRYGRMSLQIEAFGKCEAEKVHDEFVRPEMRCGEAEAAFSGFDSGYSFRVLCWCEMGVLNRSHPFLYHFIIRMFGFIGESLVQEDVEGPCQSEVAVNVFFLDQPFDCLDMSNFVVGDLGSRFQTVLFDVVGHVEIDFWP